MSKTYVAFSNGTEYCDFLSNYCLNCARYHEDKDGMPTRNSCRIEKAMANARFDPKLFPDYAVYVPEGAIFNTCIKFISKEDYKKQRKRPVRKPVKNQISIGEMNE